MSRDPTARLERLMQSVRMLAPTGDTRARERIAARLDAIIQRRSGWSDQELRERNQAAARRWAELHARGLSPRAIEDAMAADVGLSGDELRALTDELEAELNEGD